MPELDLGGLKAVLIAGMLPVLWVLEGVAPMYAGRRHRLGHDAANLALGLLNAVLAAFLLAGLLAGAAEWAELRGIGLARLVAWPAWVEWIAVLVLFDFWMYAWHVANHKVPLLWRFHAVHHSDADLDATSAVRFHTGEIVMSSFARMAVLPLLGMTVTQLLAYELLLQPVILFHHSNVRVPPKLDWLLRLVIVTPRMHWVHHSSWLPETDSNFSSVFSWWDRLWRTLRLRDDAATLTLGLGAWGDRETYRLGGMLTQPFRRYRIDGSK